MISSARPSLKYSFSLSPLMFSNGRTAIEAFASSEGSADGLCSAAFTSSIDANRCPGCLARHRRTMCPRGSGAIKGGGSSRRTALRTSAVGVAAERAGAGQHLVEDGAQAEHVRARVERTPLRLFGRHVCGGARHDALARVRHVRLRRHDLRQAEVEHLGAAVARDEDVGRLEIAMEDALLMRDMEGVGNLHGHARGVLRRQRPAQRRRLPGVPGRDTPARRRRI